jgi:hypothetical protein
MRLNNSTMATVIYRPFQATQNSTGTQLAWTVNPVTWGYNDRNLCHAGPLAAIALPDGSLTGRSTTGELTYSHYRTGTAPTGTLNGIELIVYAHKQSRVLDKTVQLKLDGALIGNNKAADSTDGYHVYGGTADMWGTALTLGNITALGVTLQYQSNKIIPHRDTVYVDTAWLRLTYTP